MLEIEEQILLMENYCGDQTDYLAYDLRKFFSNFSKGILWSGKFTDLQGETSKSRSGNLPDRVSF